MGFGLEFWFTVLSFGFRDLIVGFRVRGLRFCFNVRGFCLGIWDLDFGLRVLGLGFSSELQGLGFRLGVWFYWSRVEGVRIFWCRHVGLGVLG